MSRGGRGRGRGNVTFNMESIGFGKGDALPPPTLQPPPLYPPLRQPALPLLTGDDVNYMLALKKEFVQTMKNSPYYIQAEEAKSDVDRYSDKYRATRNTDNTIAWKPDWKRLPKELQIAVRKKRKASSAAASAVPNLSNIKKRTKNDESDIKAKLEVLEKQDSKTENAKSDEEEDSDAGEEEVVVEDEEDNEEENDYLTSYFDNGESYLDEEEDNLDEKDGGIY
uniref:DNA-directed RNA polymerase III subunit n=1 Tax=Phallusia mammillata TaxID=59560 RepID=A0A6F9DPX8_9ASCI|nr:DNA-directed RNA polymerase III subunit RPC7-like [Phallusia mammillata]